MSDAEAAAMRSALAEDLARLDRLVRELDG
jgi:uncharacterized protein HemX